MSTLTIELPAQEEQIAFNLRRWEEILRDPELAKIEGRMETDRHGHIILHAIASASHGGYQSEIGHLLRTLLKEGGVFTECPISTADGVRAADVAWASRESVRALGNKGCFPRSPEICVEVLSPGNSEAEIREKMALYFDAGAKEVWICDMKGNMGFFRSGAKQVKESGVCPEFPGRIKLAEV